MIGLVAAALAAVVPAPPGAAEAWAPRRVAVVVGIQDYADPALQGLRFATKDAVDLGAALRRDDVGDFDRVFVITGASATRREALLDALRVATADLSRDDTFLLYLSGHGTLTLDPLEGSRLWLLPSDARLDDPDRTGIAVREIEELVNDLPARRRVLVLDTCHNGRAGSKSSLDASTSALLQGMRGEIPAPRAERDVSESEARLYAAQFYQPAMEDPALENGVYTHFLLAALTGERRAADLDRDGLVDVAEAHQFARDRTIAHTGGLQIPRAEYRIVGREDIFLSGAADTRSAAERALISAYDGLLERARILVDGIPRGELPSLVAVDAGPALIEVETADGRRLLRERVVLDPGERVSVEALLERRASQVEVAVGPRWWGGEGLHPLQAGIELAWVRPFDTSARWRPDLHLGMAFAGGPLAANFDRDTTTGELWAGGAWAWSPGAAYVGPSLDLRVPWRVTGEAGWAEAGLAPSAGAVAGLAFPVGAHTWLDLRADGWGGAVPWAGQWTPTWGAGLRLGVARAR